MSTAARKVRYTAQEYLEIERAAEFKSEFHDGEIFPMARNSFRHSLILGNVLFAIRTQTRDGDCVPLMSDLRVSVEPTGLYTYPDLLVVCGPPGFLDNQSDTLLNPTVIIEILSPSTESWDRGGKFGHYRRIDSLREYVLVAQDRARVEKHARQGEDWALTTSETLDGVLQLASIGCELTLREVYARISFDPPLPS